MTTMAQNGRDQVHGFDVLNPAITLTIGAAATSVFTMAVGADEYVTALAYIDADSSADDPGEGLTLEWNGPAISWLNSSFLGATYSATLAPNAQPLMWYVRDTAWLQPHLVENTAYEVRIIAQMSALTTAAGNISLLMAQTAGAPNDGAVYRGSSIHWSRWKR